ncbi:MAG: hypothetical protein II454_00360 [Bacteroidales bacterium]|nr:hypothetical protein [Bacteroidales bacterium]
MATIQQIRDKILSGDYPSSDFWNDCIENGEIENILFDLTLESITSWNDNRKRTLLDMSIDLIKSWFPFRYRQYTQLGRGPYQYKIKNGKFLRDSVGLKELETPPVRCLILTNYDKDRLEGIFNKLVERGYIDGTSNDALPNFLNMFYTNTPQGKVIWIKKGSKNNGEINKYSWLMFLRLLGVNENEWELFTAELSNIEKCSDKVTKLAKAPTGKAEEIYNELKNILGV